MNTVKQHIREQIIQKRKQLSINEKVVLSRSILRNLYAFPEFQKAKTIHTYLSSKNNEVDTFELIVELLSQNRRVVVPIANTTTKMMTHSFLYSINDLQKGPYGIWEPKDIFPVLTDQIDIALIPVVAVDSLGNRIGFGAGFYDRFLNNIFCLKIGFAYEFQIVDVIPPEEHDIPLDYVITENRILSCRRTV